MERISDIIELDTLNNSTKITPLDRIPVDPILESRRLKKQPQNSIEPEIAADELIFSSLEKIMSEAISDLKQCINEKIFNTWFNDLKLIAIEPVLTGSTTNPNDISADNISKVSDYLNIVIGCPNKFSQDHLKNQYSNALENTFKKITGSNVNLRFDVLKTSSLVPKKPEPKMRIPVPVNYASQERQSGKANNNTSSVSGNQTLQKSYKNHSADESNLNFNYNFSNFVIGSCNQFAQAACLKVSECPGTAYNPLLIYGGVGLGKTHLANAVGNAARRRNKKVLLVSSEKFVSELVGCIKSYTMDKFRSKFRSIDVLIIDDVQFMIGKEKTQEEFFHTFNELYGKQKQIIITSDKLPKDLNGLEERLRTRFSSGLSVDLQAPDFETRNAILIKKAESFGLLLTYDVAKIIADRIDTNVRELEGALTRLQALCSLFNQSPTEDMARKVVDTISPIKLKEITADSIKDAVARQFNVSINDLSGKRRTQNIALARQVAMFLCRKHTARSFPEIGAIFGGRDHSTVIHAIKTMKDRMTTETSLQDHINSIIHILEK